MGVFVGPSKDPDVDFGVVHAFPPAAAGTLIRAADEGFTHLVLSDTLFFDAPPTHQEILAVLARGVNVFGCCSAGALRAIELAGHGMAGCGIVHGLYQAGHLIDDAEVACVLDDQYRAVTPTLLDVRYYLGYALASGFPLAAVTAAFNSIRSVYFMKRDYDTVHRLLVEHLSGEERLLKRVDDPLFRIKWIDLENCLSCIAEHVAISPRPFRRRSVDPAWIRAGVLLGS
jgi:hypothetical protein